MRSEEVLGSRGPKSVEKWCGLSHFEAETTARLIFPIPKPRAISALMSEQKPTYVVSVFYKPEGQQPYWKTLLSTGDLEKANALIESLRQDGVNAKYEMILPRKPKR